MKFPPEPFVRARHFSLIVAVALGLSACATQTDVPDTTPVAGGVPPPSVPASAADVAPAAGGYKLTAEEQKLDCPKLTGQMKVRISNMRAAYAAPAGTAAGRALQSVTTPVFGGPQRGRSREGDLAMDRAKLDAFNARLAEKKCKTFDIDAELRGTPPAAAPAPATPSSPAAKPVPKTG